MIVEKRTQTILKEKKTHIKCSFYIIVESKENPYKNCKFIL